jgi:4-aminobutyrate aminotransferase
MQKNELLTEGDINFSSARKTWYSLLDSATIQGLAEDAAVFLHQSLSTPCLDVIVSCEGIYITDAAGKKYMDFHGNNVHQVGYRNPYVLEKVKAQMDILPFSPRRYTNPVTIAFANKLISLLPANLNRVLFAPGGTSAVSMALKLAKVVTGKHQVISMKNSFHGASLDAIAVGGELQFKKYMGVLSPETFHINQPEQYRNKDLDEGAGDAEELETILKNNPEVGAFIAETIRNTDVKIPSVSYWKKVREICTKYNVLLILDEIPIAFGRTGVMFAFEHYQIEPDIICLGKGLGAGIIPFAAIVTKDAYNIATDVSLGHFTHEKSPLGAAAALAMLEYLEQKHILEKVREDEIFVRDTLVEMQSKYPVIGSVRGIGLLWAIELLNNPETKEKAVDLAEKVLYECLENGLNFKVSGGNVIQLCPPLIISRTELKNALQIVELAIAKFSKME